jgi:hypothetical protein
VLVFPPLLYGGIREALPYRGAGSGKVLVAAYFLVLLFIINMQWTRPFPGLGPWLLLACPAGLSLALLAASRKLNRDVEVRI